MQFLPQDIELVSTPKGTIHQGFKETPFRFPYLKKLQCPLKKTRKKPALPQITPEEDYMVKKQTKKTPLPTFSFFSKYLKQCFILKQKQFNSCLLWFSCFPSHFIYSYMLKLRWWTKVSVNTYLPYRQLWWKGHRKYKAGKLILCGINILAHLQKRDFNRTLQKRRWADNLLRYPSV